MTHDRVAYYRQKVAEGVNYEALFAGMVETIAVSSEYFDRVTEEDTEELKKLAKAYREFEDERLRQLIGGDAE